MADFAMVMIVFDYHGKFEGISALLIGVLLPTLFFFCRYWGYYSRTNEAWAKHWATNGVSSLGFLSLLLLQRTIFTQCFSAILFDHVFNVWFSQSAVDWSHYCWTFFSCSYTEMLALEFFCKTVVFADTYVLWLLNLVLTGLGCKVWGWVVRSIIENVQESSFTYYIRDTGSANLGSC